MGTFETPHRSSAIGYLALDGTNPIHAECDHTTGKWHVKFSALSDFTFALAAHAWKVRELVEMYGKLYDAAHPGTPPTEVFE
ncbi:Uncharacterised protein [Mycobacteroides abscessus subsp. massiliense]|nr:Uncharacterised protein [Mycobacteroides abscessus subsp. massiliense]